MKQLFAFTLLLFSVQVSSHAQEVNFSPQVNIQAYNNLYPSLSGDGRAVAFFSSYTQDGFNWLFYSRLEGGWTKPEPLPRSLGPGKMHYQFGFSLSYTGDRIYFTSRRSGIGGYDMFYSDLQEDGSWSYAQNLNKPVNTLGNEGSPSVTPDGEKLFFIRCEEMEITSAKGCKIYMSTREKGDRWSEGQLLPDYINRGNIASVRVLPNGTSLVFSSDKQGGKGGYDIYQTDYLEGKWSKPLNLQYLNTSSNEFTTDMALIAGAAVINRKQKNNSEQIMNVRIPADYLPPVSLLVDGMFEEKINSRSIIYDLTSETLLSDNFEEKSGKLLILPKDHQYLFVDIPAQSKRKITARSYRTDMYPRSRAIKDSWDNAIPSIGESIIIEGLKYSTEEPYLSENLDLLLGVSRMIRANPQMTFDFELVMKGYREDSLKSSVDLTEIRIDSMEVRDYKILFHADTTLSDSLHHTIDSLVTKLNEGDTPADSLLKQVIADTIWNSSWRLDKVYHNDRSEKEGIALKEYFISQGIDENRFTIKAIRKKEEDEYLPRYLKINFR